MSCPDVHDADHPHLADTHRGAALRNVMETETSPETGKLTAEEVDQGQRLLLACPPHPFPRLDTDAFRCPPAKSSGVGSQIQDRGTAGRSLSTAPCCRPGEDEDGARISIKPSSTGRKGIRRQLSELRPCFPSKGRHRGAGCRAESCRLLPPSRRRRGQRRLSSDWPRLRLSARGALTDVDRRAVWVRGVE